MSAGTSALAVFIGKSYAVGVVGFLCVVLLVTFILACSALGAANKHIEHNGLPSWSYTGQLCPYGENEVWGLETFEYNGHYYQLVPMYEASITYRQAIVEAEARCFNGMPGYLATPTTAAENAFLKSLLPYMDAKYNYQYAAWLGATDTTEEGTWKWNTGPEKGQTFFVGDGASGSPVEGFYNNWYCDVPSDDDDGEEFDDDDAPWGHHQAGRWNDDDWHYCEPNQSQGNMEQDCLMMYGDGTWNDISCYYGANALFVEFGNDNPLPPDEDEEQEAQAE